MELPATPAANRNGSNGKQQLDAAKTLPIAATLATDVRVPGEVIVGFFTPGAAFEIFVPLSPAYTLK